MRYREDVMTGNAHRRRVSKKRAHFLHRGRYLAVEEVCFHSFADWEQLVKRYT